MSISNWSVKKLSRWLSKEKESDDIPTTSFTQLYQEIQPGDILLVEGNSRISKTIKFLTHSNWSHAALCLGKHTNITNPKLHEHLMNNYHDDKEEILLLEEFVGQGTIVTPLSKYIKYNLRICRPIGLTSEDARKIMDYCVGKIGYDYNLRQIFDLMRLLLPITFLPRRLFSTIFKYNEEGDKQSVCSSLLAEAFRIVKFPILPKVVKNLQGEIELVPRNPKLCSPQDFDYSPYFEIIKPPLSVGRTTEPGYYRHLPWNQKGLISNDEAGFYDPSSFKLPVKEARKSLSKPPFISSTHNQTD